MGTILCPLAPKSFPLFAFCNWSRVLRAFTGLCDSPIPIQSSSLPFAFLVFLSDRKDLLLCVSSRQRQASHQCRVCHLSRGSQLGVYLTPQPSGVSRFSATPVFKLIRINLVKPHFLEMWMFWRPGNLILALLRASVTCSWSCSFVQVDMIIWPMRTLATVPWGFPEAPRTPAPSLSAPAQDMLMQMTWKRWGRSRV